MEQLGEIVTREDLRKKIWPSDTLVDFDHGINNAIKRLREAWAAPPNSTRNEIPVPHLHSL
jgi:DNA-binding response OmpR family regulator